MLWSGSSPLAVLRGGMWGFLLFAGTAWLAIAWSVLRLQPSDIVHVAGPVVLFAALTEAVRALAGTRTWWLNAGMAALFAATGVVLLAGQDTSFTTPAALLGWYLMVRGAADIAMSMMTRETDRIWGLLMVVGVLETSLGFFAASPLSRTADLVVTVLGGLALARGVADLVAALRLREVSAATTDMLELPPERAAGLAGYSAGLTDYPSAPARSGPKHRAPAKPRTATVVDPGDWTISPGSIGPVASPGAAVAGGMAGAAGYTADAEYESAEWTPAPEWTGATDWPETTPGTATSEAAARFHDEVLQTTADLDAMLALAGVTGAAVSPPPHYEAPEVPDTAEGAETAELSER